MARQGNVRGRGLVGDPFGFRRVDYEPGQLFFGDTGSSWQEERARLEAEIADLRGKLSVYEERERKRDRDKERRTRAVLSKWKVFNERHPHVWRAVVAHLEARLAAGGARTSIQNVWTDLRYERGPHGVRVGFPSLSNELSTIYERRLAEERPDLAAMLDIRASRFDGMRPWAEPVTSDDRRVAEKEREWWK